MGRAPDDFELTAWSGAVAGTMLAAYLRAVNREEDPIAPIDPALDYLEAGLRL